MELSKCLGCMDDLQGYPCPHCGYDPVKEKRPEYALPPETILAGKYLVGRVLGQGGFGITYIGWDLALERKVAIKEYYPSGQVSRSPGTRSLTWYTNEPAVQAREDGMKMFLKEARKMVKADSIPGVVRVLDLFQENGTAYIVMDFVSGETLKTRLQKTGPMTWTQAAPIFRPAIRAMEQVHQAGLIHRDLSPDNLMLTPNGDVKILDLGAAKDLNLNSGASSMQVAKSGFSPFEQYTQRGGSGPWTDVYAMAATLYFTLTGKLPPVATDRVDEDTISWDIPCLDTLPWAALAAMKKAMAVSAKQRTQSMEELEKGLFEAGQQPKVVPKEKGGPKPKPKPEPAPDVKPEAYRQRQSEPETKSQSAPKENRNKLLLVAAAAVAVVLGGIFWGMGKLAQDYEKAQALMDAGQYNQAQTAFEALGSYQDSAQKAKDAQKQEENQSAYQQAQALMDFGQYPGAAIAFSKLGDYQDSEERAQEARGKQQIVSIAGGLHTVGLRRDGTVVAVGGNDHGQCDVSGWRDIVAVAAGNSYTVGLRRDGTVVAVGDNYNGQCDVSGWRDIVAVAAGDIHTVGLRRDGTVVAMGYNGYGRCDVSDWRDIVAVAAGSAHTVGLRRDGTVVAVGSNLSGRCNVSDWRDIVAVAAGVSHTVGLRRNGTVVAVGNNTLGQCDVSDWRDIVAVAAGGDYTVGLRRDGTVVAVGYNGDGQCDVSGWRDIVAVAAGGNHTVGLRRDGTVVAVGHNGLGQCDVSDWTDIRTP